MDEVGIVMVPGIDQLRDIHGIQSVPWWPPAIGWWLIAAAIVGLLYLAWRWRTSIRLRIPPLPVFNIGSWRWTRRASCVPCAIAH